MKFIPDFLKREKPDATQPPKDIAEKPADKTPEGSGILGRYVTGPLGDLKDKVFRKKDAGTVVIDLDAEKDEDNFDPEKLRKKLTDLLESHKKNKVTKAFIIVGGCGVAAAAMAADVMFLSGTVTLMVASAVYSDLRNTQHIGKISEELAKIDEKIDALQKEQKPVPDYAPALDAVQTRIAAFQQAAAKDLPPAAAAELAKLREQVEGLQQKIAPANDDGAKGRQAVNDGPSR